MVNGAEVHTLTLDQENALIGLLEAAGQSKAIDAFRQYNCANLAESASSELGDTVAVLKYLRTGQTNQAIQRLEQNLRRNANLICNSYGGLNPTNRERVNLDSLQQTRDYFSNFPAQPWDVPTEKAANEILRLAHEQAKK